MEDYGCYFEIGGVYRCGKTSMVIQQGPRPPFAGTTNMPRNRSHAPQPRLYHVQRPQPYRLVLVTVRHIVNECPGLLDLIHNCVHRCRGRSCISKVVRPVCPAYGYDFLNFLKGSLPSLQITMFYSNFFYFFIIFFLCLCRLLTLLIAIAFFSL